MNITHLIIKRHKLTHKKNPPLQTFEGYMSYMGQILRQLDQPTFKKDNKLAYTLNEVANLQDIPPFTTYCQKRIVQTDLATQLINIQVGNEYALTQLLAKHNITVTFQDQG